MSASNTSKPVSNETWQIAVTLARQTVRDRLPLTPPLAITMDTDFVEHLTSDALYAPSKIRKHLLIQFTTLQSWLQQEDPTLPLLRGHCSLGALLSFLDNVGEYLVETDDERFLDEVIDGTTVEGVLFQILHLIWSHYHIADVGLLFDYGGCDAFEMSPVHLESVPRVIRSYPNLIFIKILNALLEDAKLDEDVISRWKSRRDALGASCVKHFWDPGAGQVKVGVAVDPDDTFAQSNWAPFLPHTSALFLMLNLVPTDQTVSVRNALSDKIGFPSESVFGMCTTPVLPSDVLAHYQFKGWTHVQGGENTQLCARSALYLYRAGLQQLGRQLLGHIAKQAEKDEGFFRWYTPDGCPQGARPSNNAARAFLGAWKEIGSSESGETIEVDESKTTMLRPRMLRALKPKENKRKPIGFKKAAYVEKRDSLRLPLEMHVTITTGKVFKKSDLNAALRFPSTQGMALVTSVEFPEGASVRIEVDTSQRGGNKTCLLKGKIVWARPKIYNLLHQYGIELDTNFGDHGDWERFILKKIKKTPASALKG